MTKSFEAAAVAPMGTTEKALPFKTAVALMESAFERNRKMSMDDHVAEEMQIIMNNECI